MNVIYTPFQFEVGQSVRIHNGDLRWDGCEGVIQAREQTYGAGDMWEGEYYATNWYEVEVLLPGQPLESAAPMQRAAEQDLS